MGRAEFFGRPPHRPERAIFRPQVRSPNREPNGARRRSSERDPEVSTSSEQDVAVSKLLAEYAQEQTNLKEAGFFKDFDRLEGAELFEEYVQTDLFQKTCGEKEGLGLDFHGSPRLKGKIFADLAHCVMSAKTESGIIVPGEGVLEIAKIVYPDNKVKKHPFGQSSLDGQYIPDGLAVNQDGLITGMYEYKLSDKNGKGSQQQEKADGFVRRIRYLFSEDPEVTIVMPRQKTSQLGGKRLPFTQEQFNAYFRDFFHSQ